MGRYLRFSLPFVQFTPAVQQISGWFIRQPALQEGS